MEKAVIVAAQDRARSSAAGLAVLVDVDVPGARIAVAYPAVVRAPEPHFLAHLPVDLFRAPLRTRAVARFGIDAPIVAVGELDDEGNAVGGRSGIRHRRASGTSSRPTSPPPAHRAACGTRHRARRPELHRACRSRPAMRHPARTRSRTHTVPATADRVDRCGRISNCRRLARLRCTMSAAHPRQRRPVRRAHRDSSCRADARNIRCRSRSGAASVDTSWSARARRHGRPSAHPPAHVRNSARRREGELHARDLPTVIQRGDFGGVFVS